MGQGPSKPPNSQLLLEAVAAGDLAAVQAALAAASDPAQLLASAHTGRLHGHKTALHVAASAGQTGIVTAVLQPLVIAVATEMASGIYPGPAAEALQRIINRRDSRRGRTPLLSACEHGHAPTAEVLLEAGANVFAVDRDGNSVLHLACLDNHMALVTQLLAKAEAQAITHRLVNCQNLGGCSPLHYAAWGGHADLVRLLLTAGANQHLTTCSDYDRRTAAAALRLSMQLCSAVARKPSTRSHLSSFCNSTSVAVAAMSPDLPCCCRRVLVVPLRSTALHTAALQQHGPVCLALLQQHALAVRDWLPGDPRPVDPRSLLDVGGSTPLQLALWKGLNPSSQLAACLNPRLAITALFTPLDAGVDALRRRGPPALKLIAAAAVQGSLLEQLGSLQQRQRRQQQLLRLQRQKEKEQRQQQQQQQQQQSGESWQRWWLHSARVTAESADHHQQPQQPGKEQQHQEAHGRCSGPGSPALVSPGSVSGIVGSSKEQQHAELLQALRRTPSATLGAIQFVSSSSQHSAAGSCKSSPASSSADATAVAAAAAPAAAGDGTLEVPAASTAAAAAAAAEPQEAAIPGFAATAAESASLLKRSSITVGCLDSIWSLAEEQQGQQQGQQARTAGETQPHPSSLADRSGPEAAVLRAPAAATAVVTPQRQPAGEIQVADDGQQEQQSCAGKEPAAAAQAATSDAALHRSTGAMNVFALVSLQPQQQQLQQQQPQLQHQQQQHASAASRASSSSSSHSRPSPVRSLQTTSVTLAQLPSSSSIADISASSNTSAAAAAAATPHGSILAAIFKQEMQQRQQQRQRQVSRAQSTAGIRTDDGQQLTPFTWKLLQQQQQQQQSGGDCHDAFHKQDRISLSSIPASSSSNSTSAGEHSIPRDCSLLTGPGPLASSAPSAADTATGLQGLRLLGSGGQHKATAGASGSKALPGDSAGHWQQQAACHSVAGSFSGSRSHGGSIGRLNSGGVGTAAGHRRSFELPGSSGSMQAVFGASSQHISQMLQAAGSADPGWGLAAHSRTTLISRAGSLAVATSLAGALPGCVSERLSQLQFLEAVPAGQSCSKIGAGGDGAACSGSVSPPSGAATPGFGDCASSLASGAETCAVCFEKPPVVALNGCGHVLCFGCAGCIVREGVGCRPPLCPFCRRNITGFSCAAVAEPEVVLVDTWVA